MDAPLLFEHAGFAATEELTSAAGAAVNPDYLAPEDAALRRLCELARLPPAQQAAVQAHALQLVLGRSGRTLRQRWDSMPCCASTTWPRPRAWS
jgi:hypothetical protein